MCDLAGCIYFHIKFRRLCAISPVVHQGYIASAILPVAWLLLCAISPIARTSTRAISPVARTPHCSALPVVLRCIHAISPVVWASVACSLADCDFMQLPWCHPDVNQGGLLARACNHVLLCVSLPCSTHRSREGACTLILLIATYCSLLHTLPDCHYDCVHLFVQSVHLLSATLQSDCCVQFISVHCLSFVE